MLEQKRNILKSALALRESLRADHAKVWHDTWANCISARFVEYAVGQISFASGKVSPRFRDLDDPLKRSALVPNDSATIAQCSKLLMNSKDLLHDIVCGVGLRKLSNAQLTTLLIEGEVVSHLIGTISSECQLITLGLKRVWPELANRIGKDIFLAETSGPPDPEWLLWNKLLIARYFHGCHLDKAGQVAAQMDKVVRGLHGPRTAFIAIVERLSANGINDPALPHTCRSGSRSTSLSTAHLSDLLDAIQYESNQMQNHQGALHRIVDMRRPVDGPVPLGLSLTQMQIVEHRNSIYRQYEASILCYGVFSAIEQLLRSLATRVGVNHLTGGGYPAPASEWLGDAKFCFDQDLRDKLMQIYSTEGPNLRNRAMHAGLLEIESKRTEVLLAPRHSALGPTRSTDPFVPENLLSICMDALIALDTHVTAAGLCKNDFSWTESVWLSSEELDFGNQIPCDVLDRDRALDWQRQLFDFVDSSIACFSLYVKMAWNGWMKEFERHNSLISFLAWGVTFEGVFRLALHTLGFDVIQRTSANGDHRMFQYRMLDQRPGGLCRPEAISALVRGLKPTERPIAEKTLNLAVKARNALSHGAIAHDESSHLAAGHLFIKATQLLMFTTMENMTRVRAYYRFLARQHTASGDPINDWLLAEDETSEMIAKVAAAQRQPLVCRD